MSELPVSSQRIFLEELHGIMVYKEPYLDGWVIIAEAPTETLRLYEDGSQSYTNQNGQQTTYYPDNRFTLDAPGEPTIHGKTFFRVKEFD